MKTLMVENRNLKMSPFSALLQKWMRITRKSKASATEKTRKWRGPWSKSLFCMSIKKLIFNTYMNIYKTKQTNSDQSRRGRKRRMKCREKKETKWLQSRIPDSIMEDEGHNYRCRYIYTSLTYMNVCVCIYLSLFCFVFLAI